MMVFSNSFKDERNLTTILYIFCLIFVLIIPYFTVIVGGLSTLMCYMGITLNCLEKVLIFFCFLFQALLTNPPINDNANFTSGSATVPRGVFHGVPSSNDHTARRPGC